VHQVVVGLHGRGRAGTKAQKTRSDVRGGGIKPWRQKGTGRARAGTIRSPIWVGGGRAFAARPRDFEQKVNRKMYRAAHALDPVRAGASGSPARGRESLVEAPKTRAPRLARKGRAGRPTAAQSSRLRRELYLRRATCRTSMWWTSPRSIRSRCCVFEKVVMDRAGARKSRSACHEQGTTDDAAARAARVGEERIAAERATRSCSRCAPMPPSLRSLRPSSCCSTSRSTACTVVNPRQDQALRRALRPALGLEEGVRDPRRGPRHRLPRRE
jgi:hypothetical protein